MPQPSSTALISVRPLPDPRIFHSSLLSFTIVSGFHLIEALPDAGENELFLPSLWASIATMAGPLPGLQRLEYYERGTAGADR
jgi:hypothetical protein